MFLFWFITVTNQMGHRLSLVVELIAHHSHSVVHLILYNHQYKVKMITNSQYVIN